MKGHFETVGDNQTWATICVYEGEELSVDKYHLLGEFQLCGMTPAPKGVVKMIDTFCIDANGILTVTTEEEGTSNKNQITINKRNGRLSEREIDEMAIEAKKFSIKDAKCRTVAKAKECLENYVNDLQDLLRESGWKFEKKDKKVIEDAVKRTIKWLDANSDRTDASKYERKMDKVRSICEPSRAKIYGKGTNVCHLASAY